jgi:tRNA G26 N,N-dimethylase Trm1
MLCNAAAEPGTRVLIAVVIAKIAAVAVIRMCPMQNRQCRRNYEVMIADSQQPHQQSARHLLGLTSSN